MIPQSDSKVWYNLLSNMVKYRKRIKAVRVTLFVRIDTDLKYKLMVEAREAGMTQGAFVERLIRTYFAIKFQGRQEDVTGKQAEINKQFNQMVSDFLIGTE